MECFCGKSLIRAGIAFLMQLLRIDPVETQLADWKSSRNRTTEVWTNTAYKSKSLEAEVGGLLLETLQALALVLMKSSDGQPAASAVYSVKLAVSY